MKTPALKWIFIFLMISSRALWAAESLPLENIAVSKPQQNSASIPFSVTIGENEKLKIKPGHVFTEGGDYRATALPYLISSPKPIAYPRWAIRQGWEGELVIAVEVLKDGSVGRCKVMKSTGHRVLDKVATDAVRSWKFQPAVKDGKLVVTCIEIPVTFELR